MSVTLPEFCGTICPMTETTRLTHYLTVLNATPAETLGSRLKARRLRKFKSAAEAGRAIEQAGGPVSRSYGWHEAGDPRRRPDLGTLALYAQVLETSLEFLLFGDDDAEATQQVIEHFHRHRNDIRPRINQETNRQPLPTSHNSTGRSIVMLTATQIRQLSDDVGALTKMSGRKIAVPDGLIISDETFWYTVPAHDVSMVDRSGPLSLHPGTICLIDLKAQILRGKCVLAQLRDFDEPVIRVFQAEQPYKGRGPFTLVPLNGNFETVTVEDAADCPLLGRVMFLGLKF